MKVGKTSEEEISRLAQLLNEIEWLHKEFQRGYNFSDIDWIDYEILQKMNRDEPEKFLKEVCASISGIHFQRILMNCSMLLENCADRELTYLDYNADIKRGLELLEKETANEIQK